MNPEVVGLVASVFLSVAGLPQVIKSYRTKKVEDISIVMILLLLFAFGLWIIYGIAISEIPILIVNGISFMFMAVALLLKLSKTERKKRLNQIKSNR